MLRKLRLKLIIMLVLIAMLIKLRKGINYFKDKLNWWNKKLWKLKIKMIKVFISLMISIKNKNKLNKVLWNRLNS